MQVTTIYNIIWLASYKGNFHSNIFSLLDCPVLQQPEYGSISSVLSNPLHDNSVNFSCDDGYHLLGSAERTCMSGGEWSGTTVTCRGNFISSVTAYTYIL